MLRAVPSATENLGRYISERGGWVTSAPGASKLRFEIALYGGQALANEIAALGHAVIFQGERERAGRVAVHFAVAVYSVEMA